MRRLRFGSWVVLLMFPCASSMAQTTTLVSRSTTGQQANDWSFTASLSADARYVAFASQASNLAHADGDHVIDTFVRDTLLSSTACVSVGFGGVDSDGESLAPSISADGRFVAIESDATNLVSIDANGAVRDVFVRDVVNGTTELVSVSSSGAQGSASSTAPAISGSGRYVAFESVAANLVAGDTNGVSDIFVRDRETGTTEIASISSTGVRGNAFSGFAAISADGRFVAFRSGATNLVFADTNSQDDVFVHDRLTGMTERVSIDSTGAQADGGSSVPSISADGRYVAFDSVATNLVAGDTNGASDVFVHDRLSGATVRVSVEVGGAEGNADSLLPSISANGLQIAFVSFASNLVPNDVNGKLDAFVHDLAFDVTELQSASFFGNPLGGGSNFTTSISADGRSVAFESFASDIVADDAGSNLDVFLRERGALPAPMDYCVAKTNSLGCTPLLVAVGAPSATAGSGFVVTATNVRNRAFGLLFYGLSGATAVPFAGGFLCVTAPRFRTPGISSLGNAAPIVDCSGTYPFDFNAYVASGVHPALSAGRQVWAQFVSRDNGFAPPDNIGLTSAITFVIGP